MEIESPTECPSDMNETDKTVCCSKFNESLFEHGWIFRTCCEYPQLVVFRWHYEECESRCKNIPQMLDQQCCIIECAMQKLKVLQEEKFNGVEIEGLKFSLMLSVSSSVFT